MFCPKCGGEATDGQRFCKACGTNLQLINDAIRPGAPQGPFGIDVETLTRNAREFAESWKKGWKQPKVIGVNIDRSAVKSVRAARLDRASAYQMPPLLARSRGRDHGRFPATACVARDLAGAQQKYFAGGFKRNTSERL